MFHHMVIGKPKAVPQHVICIQSRIHYLWKKQGWTCPEWTSGLNSRWLPGTINKTIPDTLGKSIWLSAVALVPGTGGFLYQMGEASRTAASRAVKVEDTEEHILNQSCHGYVSATIVWDHCEGHLLAVGREREMERQAVHGLKDLLSYGFGEE